VGVHDLPPDTATCLFRVAQEALRNVVRHAEANQARLTLRKDGSRVTLTVADDGRGFDASPPLQMMLYSLARRDHFGLVNLVERVQAIGGQVSIQSSTGQGTQLRVEAPIVWEDGDPWTT
jgi:signal transduction histidine kinase